MRLAGFNIEAVKKTSVETSIRKFHEYDIYIVDGSEEVFNEFENYKYARDKRTNEILGVPAERQADHSIDGTRYVLLSRDFRWSI
jgi:phage terminase large subunit